MFYLLSFDENSWHNPAQLEEYNSVIGHGPIGFQRTVFATNCQGPFYAIDENERRRRLAGNDDYVSMQQHVAAICFPDRMKHMLSGRFPQSAVETVGSVYGLSSRAACWAC